MDGAFRVPVDSGMTTQVTERTVFPDAQSQVPEGSPHTQNKDGDPEAAVGSL